MFEFIRTAWANAAEAALAIAEAALDATVTLYAAMCALPLPIALMAVAAGVALFHAIDQRAARRDNR